MVAWIKRLWPLIFLWPLLAFSVIGIPALRDPVTDEARVLSSDATAYLNHELRRLRDSGGSQIAVLTVPSLEGEDIAAYSIRVADAWKLGSESKDNGVLLVIAKEDRKLRIEVGQGNEGNLTDLQSSRIIEKVITPLFKQGDFDNGVVAGVASIINATDPTFTLANGAPERKQRVVRSRGGSSLIPVLFFIFLMLFLFSRGRGGRGGGGNGALLGALLGYGAGGGFGRGGGGGFGGGGGGGFGGGGGGFSGGGASGEW